MRLQGTALVVGGTGVKGRSVGLALLDGGADVRALVRNRSNRRARRLAEAGAELVVGDLRDAPSLEAALVAVDAAYVKPLPRDSGAGAVRSSGRTLGRALEGADVGQVVLESTAAAAQPDGVPAFTAQAKVDRTLRDRLEALTVARPALFLDTVHQPWRRRALRDGRLRLPLPSQRPVTTVTAPAYGRIVAGLMEGGARWRGKRVPIATCRVTPEGIARAFRNATGHDLVHERVGLDEVAQLSSFHERRWRWIAEHGFDRVPIREEFRRKGPATPEAWLDAVDPFPSLAR